MTLGMLRQVILCKQKNWRWPSWNQPPANSAIGTARYSLTLKKYETVFKVKDHLRIIFFLENKHLRDLLISCPRLLYVTVQHNLAV